MPRTQILKLLERTNSFTFIGRIRKPVRKKEYLHGLTMKLPPLREPTDDMGSHPGTRLQRQFAP